jgi:hypothetical protein
MMSTRIRTLLALLLLVSLLVIPAATAGAAGPEGNAAFDVKFAGVITAVPAAEGEPWLIAGQTVKTDANSKIRLPGEEKAAAGMWADIMAKKLSDGTLLALKLTVMAPEMRLVGPLEVMPAGDLGTWTVAGIDFTVDEKTAISDRGEPIMVGGWVEVQAVEDAGALVAVRIMSLDDQEDVELYGAIQAFSDTEWTVSSVKFAMDAKTRVMGAPKAGLLAKVSLALDDEGNLLARTIKVSWDEQGGWRKPVQFTGKIETLPPGGPVGVWTIDGKQVDVSAQTKVMQHKALAEVGATVHVVGWTEGEVVKAILVAVMAPPADVTPFLLLGKIEKLPADGMVGLWTVSMMGKSYDVQVTASTRIAGQEFVKVGAAVTVVGTQKADGTMTATLIHAKQGRP